MLNMVILQGRFPASDKFKFEYKKGEEGGKHSYFRGSLSVDRNYKAKDQKYYDSDVFEVRAFGFTADNIHQFFKPGDNILVRGELVQPEPYEDQNGDRVFPKVYVNIREFQFTRGNERHDDKEATISEPAATSTTPSVNASNPFGGSSQPQFNMSTDSAPKFSFPV